MASSRTDLGRVPRSRIDLGRVFHDRTDLGRAFRTGHCLHSLFTLCDYVTSQFINTSAIFSASGRTLIWNNVRNSVAAYLISKLTKFINIGP